MICVESAYFLHISHFIPVGYHFKGTSKLEHQLKVTLYKSVSYIDEKFVKINMTEKATYIVLVW